MTAKKRSNSERWAVIRIPRALYDRILAGQGTTQHETISRAMNASEDPKCARRLREVRAELAKLQKLYDGALELVDELRKELAKQPRDAASRTLPMFPVGVPTTVTFRNVGPVNGSPARTGMFGKGIKR